MVAHLVFVTLQLAAADPREFLHSTAGFNPAEIARIDRGESVSRTLKGAVSGEVAIAGAVRMRINRSAFVEAFADMARMKRCEEVPEVGRFSREPRIDDIASLQMDDAKISPAELVSRAQRYQTAGLDSDEFTKLLQRSTFLSTHAPDLSNYLANYPAVSLPLTHDFLYWSKERIALRWVTVITHALVQEPSPGLTVLATRQVYASHYMDASLGVTFVMDTPEGVLVVYMNRSRAGILSGTFGGWKRALATDRAASTTRQKLSTLRTRLETEAVAARAAKNTATPAESASTPNSRR